MSSIKVSALTAKTTPSGSEELLINDGGTSKKITIANLPDTDTVYTHPNHSGDVVSSADGATTIQVDAVDIAMLSATGTASATTFLRGDNTWVVPTDTDTNTNQLTTFTVSATTDTNATTISQGDDLLFTAGTGITCETTADGTVTISNTVTDTDTVYTHPNHSGEVTSTGDGATVVADNVVDEANLKVSNTPTNGYVLTAQSGASGGLTWAADSTSDSTKLPLAGGTMTGTLNVAGAINADQVNLGDNDKLNFGGGEDLQIYHDGADSYIVDTGLGNLNIKTNGNNIGLLDSAGYTMIRGTSGAEVGLYHNRLLKLATTSTGIDVTGITTSTDRIEAGGGTSGGYVLKFKNPSSASNTTGFIYDNNQDNLEITTSDPSYALTFKTSNTERLRIDSSGNVLVGNTVVNPASGFADQTGFGLTSTGDLEISSDTSALELNRTTTGGGGNVLVVRKAGTVTGVIGTDNWGIGTSSPTSELEIKGTHTTNVTNEATLLSGTSLTINGNSGEGTDTLRMGAMANGTGAYFIDVSNATATANYNLLINPFNTGNVGIGTTSPSELLYVAGNIYATGNITAYSDERIKENINVVPNALDAVDAIRGVTYTRTDTEEDGVGVIAQEVEALFPELVVENNEGMKSVNYNGLVGVLFAAVKELSAEVKLLKENK